MDGRDSHLRRDCEAAVGGKNIGIAFSREYLCEIRYLYGYHQQADGTLPRESLALRLC
jgi:hypothetical protein